MKEKIKNNKWLIFVSILSIILLIVIIVLLNISVLKEDYDELQSKYDKTKNNYNEIDNLCADIKEKNSKATLYVSEEEKTIYLELRNFVVETDNNAQLDVMALIGEKLSTTLKDYEKLILTSYLNSAGKTNSLVIRDEYKLPSLEKETDSVEYILYDDYKNMYDMFSGIY